MFFACTREDAAEIGFDDDFIYEEIEKPIEQRQMEIVQFYARRSACRFRELGKKSRIRPNIKHRQLSLNIIGLCFGLCQ